MLLGYRSSLLLSRQFHLIIILSSWSRLLYSSISHKVVLDYSASEQEYLLQSNTVYQIQVMHLLRTSFRLLVTALTMLIGFNHNGCRFLRRLFYPFT
jgi:hypothetical protein